MKNGAAKTKKPFLRTKRFKAGVVVLVIVGLTTAGYLYITKPAEGTIASSTTNDQTGVLDAKTGNDHFAGSTLTFDYPSEYDDVQKNPPSGSFVEQATMVTHSSSGTRRISVAARSPLSGGIQEDSAYQLRIRQTGTYKHETVAIQGAKADKFTKSDGTEITYFIAGPSYYATLSGTSVSGGTQLADDMASVTSSFQWLK